MKKTALALSLLLAAACLLTACASGKAPEDFSFALTWNCYGVSSYDSATGKLVKTTDATHPEDYMTEYQLTAAERRQVWQLLRKLDVDSYPDEYDTGLMSKPPCVLILTVRTAAGEKTIRAQGEPFVDTARDEKGQAFLDACRTIEELLYATEAWQALPDYEHYYL